MSWYVVYTKPNAERLAVAHLGRQGFTSYCPHFSRTRRHAGREEKVLRPLFPRYLFVTLDSGNSRWRAIRSTIGVSHLVCQGESPLPVPETVIEAIRSREIGGLVVEETPPAPRPGEQVRIIDGPLAEKIGTLLKLTDSERVVVLMNLMQGEVKVDLPRDVVRRITQ
jgi:transcriptional antiterminator RfaH